MSDNKSKIMSAAQKVKQLVSDNRVLEPRIIETKQELLQALRTGQIKASKYNLLSENEKLLVELVIFGGYSAEQAVRVIDPSVKNPGTIARRMMAREEVVATIEELSISRDKKFMADVNNARDMALNKLKYIMNTTNDDALAAACAKTILDKAGEMAKQNTKKDEPIGNIVFSIQVENNYVQGDKGKEEPVIIEITPEAEEQMIKEAREEYGMVAAELTKVKNDLKKAKEERDGKPVNPKTGLPYVIAYEGVNHYGGNEDD